MLLSDLELENIVNILLNKASADSDWSAICSGIFGTVFWSNPNPETCRSIADLYNIINPLFLNDLRQELTDIHAITVEWIRIHKLNSLKDKLMSLTFLDIKISTLIQLNNFSKTKMIEAR